MQEIEYKILQLIEAGEHELARQLNEGVQVYSKEQIEDLIWANKIKNSSFEDLKNNLYNVINRVETVYLTESRNFYFNVPIGYFEKVREEYSSWIDSPIHSYSISTNTYYILGYRVKFADIKKIEVVIEYDIS